MMAAFPALIALTERSVISPLKAEGLAQWCKQTGEASQHLLALVE